MEGMMVVDVVDVVVMCSKNLRHVNTQVFNQGQGQCSINHQYVRYRCREYTKIRSDKVHYVEH